MSSKQHPTSVDLELSKKSGQDICAVEKFGAEKQWYGSDYCTVEIRPLMIVRIAYFKQHGRLKAITD